MSSAQQVYRPRNAEHTVLYGVVQEHLEAFLRAAAAGKEGRGLPPVIERKFREFLTCGILAHGFVRLHCEDYALERLRHRGPPLHLDPCALSLRWGLPPYANLTWFVYALGAFRKSISQQMHAHFGHGVDEKGFRDRGLVEAAKMGDRFFNNGIKAG